MPGGSKPETTTQTAQTQTGPWQPSQGILQGILSSANPLLPQASQINPQQAAGLSGLSTAANTAAGYTPDINSITHSLFGGGGYGTGVPGIQTAQGTAANTLGGIASGSLDPMQNPGTLDAINAIKDQVTNSVGSQFAGANRSPTSAYEARTQQDQLTKSLAPFILGQYNQNVSNATNAANSLTGNAISASGAYDASAGNRLDAQMAAPGSLSNLALPANMQLSAGGAPLQTSLGNLGSLSNMILPIAQLGQQGTSSGTQTKTPAQASTLQQILGGGTAALGALGQAGAFGGAAGAGGWLGPLLSGIGTAFI